MPTDPVMMEHPIPLKELPPALHKFCDPGAPVPARLMAAKGLVPLGPEELLTVLYQLSHDETAQVSEAARSKCLELPEAIVGGALAGALDVRVLDYYCDRYVEKEAYLQAILLNQRTAGESVARLARVASEQTCELIATNEQRLLAHPRIIEHLYNNKKARMSTATRAVELAVRNGIVLEGIAAYNEVVQAIQGELIIEEDGPTPADEAFVESLSIGEVLEEEGDFFEDDIDDDDPRAEKRKSLQFLMGRMSDSEKIRMALLGSSAHRAVLVRDSNKTVSMAAIKAPTVNDQEAIAYSANRSLSEDVIRYIASNRDWTKHYSVKLNLVHNPKTPLPKAMTFLTHLRLNDIKLVSRSKNVPQAIAQAAKQQVRKRN